MEEVAIEPLRLGYVGCGFMAQKVHLPNLTNIPECQVVAMTELRPKLGALVRERYHIPVLYSDHLELAADREIEAAGVSAAFGVPYAQSESVALVSGRR